MFWVQWLVQGIEAGAMVWFCVIGRSGCVCVGVGGCEAEAWVRCGECRCGELRGLRGGEDSPPPASAPAKAMTARRREGKVSTASTTSYKLSFETLIVNIQTTR